MKTIKILLTVLLALFLTVVTVSAQYAAAPVAPANDGYDAGVYSKPYNPAGDYYNPAGDYYDPNNDASYHRIGVPEPATITLLGIGLVAGLGYRILKKKRVN